ncbi:MAG: hypothetical protein AABY74_04030 [Planctomycetota bacterium]
MKIFICKPNRHLYPCHLPGCSGYVIFQKDETPAEFLDREKIIATNMKSLWDFLQQLLQRSKIFIENEDNQNKTPSEFHIPSTANERQ